MAEEIKCMQEMLQESRQHETQLRQQLLAKDDDNGVLKKILQDKAEDNNNLKASAGHPHTSARHPGLQCCSRPSIPEHTDDAPRHQHGVRGALHRVGAVGQAWTEVWLSSEMVLCHSVMIDSSHTLDYAASCTLSLVGEHAPHALCMSPVPCAECWLVVWSELESAWPWVLPPSTTTSHYATYSITHHPR
jgi:hypothetical protein